MRGGERGIEKRGEREIKWEGEKIRVKEEERKGVGVKYKKKARSETLAQT